MPGSPTAPCHFDTPAHRHFGEPTAPRALHQRNQESSYFNAHDRTGGTFLVTGLGVYPNLGVVDAYAAVRRGDTQRTDLTWTGAFPAVQEQPHLIMAGNRPTIDASRFAQVGSWAGTLRVDGDDITVDPRVWTGSRDRSWGIRPVGETEPAGRAAAAGPGGFWWLYVSLRFEDFAIVVIVQENPDGFRTLNDASRIWADGRVEQLGWPRTHIEYRSGTRIPVSARLELTAPDGKPLEVEIRPHAFMPLHIGCGYGSDPDWQHGAWKGTDWSSSSIYDLTDPAVAARIPWGVLDHVAQARCGDAEGWGLFEHASLGRHDPTGFANWTSVAP